jgi:hypothetical protein
MAGEFFVMERLYRLGHEPALTVGRAKTIDIIVKTKSGKLQTISVKSVRSGSKWPVGSDDISRRPDLCYVFLRYRGFDNPKGDPDVYIMRASHVQRFRKPWLKGYAIYRTPERLAPPNFERYRDAWECIG